MLFGVPQVSILEPLLFNIFLSDLFLLTKDVDITSCPDDNTPYIVGDNMDYVITALQNAAASLFKCFSENKMEANPDKCHLLINENCKKEIMIASNIIENNKCKKLLVIKINSKLSFKKHVKDFC